MRRSVTLLLLLGSLALVLFPLGINKPGMPTTLKADEPAYFMMALSLARDFDLRVEPHDIRRLTDEFPFLPVNNIILMSGDGWQTVYFGKPYIYPLIGAPAAALFGANGLVALNMAMVAAMILMGFVYLRRFNDDLLAAGFVVGFFILSSAFAYTQWLHPEIFNMFSGFLCLFFVFHRFENTEDGATGWRALLAKCSREPMMPIWSGAALTLGFYNKPMMLALALPAVWVFWRRGGLKRAAVWIASFTAMLVAICLLSFLLTGAASAYLGVHRTGVELESQNEMPELPVDVEVVVGGKIGRSSNSFEWLARLPEWNSALLRENAYYFLVGRHAGLVPYMPFSLIALVLFVLYERRSLARWLLLAGLTAMAFYFLIFIWFNWHGGGGFIGNRYFVIAYPAFLFLVTRLRPAWLTFVGYAAGALFLGAILATPFGSPVRKPTLQAHVRGPAFRLLPIELSLRSRIPGYWGDEQSGTWFWGRKDVFDPHGTEFMVHGATTVEVWMMVTEPLQDAVFQVRNTAPSNRVKLSLGGDSEVLHFGAEGWQRVVLRPRRPYSMRRERKGFDNYTYRLLITTSTSQITELRFVDEQGNPRPPQYFPLGVRVAYLGSSEELEKDMYRAEWVVSEPPATVVAGEELELPLEVRNGSDSIWPAKGAARVRVSYHWRDEAGQEVVREGLRTSLPRHLGPAQAVSLAARIRAPDEPGRYLLELDMIRERVAWFSRHRPESVLRLPVEVVAPEPVPSVAEPES